MDKRKDHRFTMNFHAKVSSKSGNFWGIVNDISENGLFIKTNKDIVLDSELDIEIVMQDNANSRLIGIVTRKVDLPDTYRKYGVGIKIIKKDVKYMKLLSFSYIGEKQLA